MPNKISIENGNKKGMIKRVIFAYCDFEDYDELSKFRWYLIINKSERSYPVAHFDVGLGGKTRRTLSTMGCFLMKPKAGEAVTYLDGDSFNVRRENLAVIKRGTYKRDSISNSRPKRAIKQITPVD